jgi:hypothetical protein
VSTLINTPFSLAWGSDIYAEVVAINDYGRSLTSDLGNGAKIIEYADKPVNLAETVSARTATTITFSWAAGALERGSAVFDYQIFRAVASVGTYTSIATGVTTLSYTAEGLVTGETYSFKVQAQNGFGYSESSDPVTILCATKPVTPIAPVTSVLADKAIITWTAPYANGTPIKGYNVYIRKADLTYVFDNSVCDGTTSAVVLSGVTQCTLPLSTLTAAPYSLLLGFKISSYVVAYNDYGLSLASPIGS